MNIITPSPAFSPACDRGAASEHRQAKHAHFPAPVWPSLGELELGRSETERRRQAIGGSDANIILSGNRERVVQLWREKRGEVEPADLTSNLAVMLGCWTEPFNKMWFEKISGKTVSLIGQTITCSSYDWRRCTLDGLIEDTGTIWEAKHCNAFARPEEVLERYMPQLQHNMAVAKAETAMLSVIFGNQKFEMFEVASDWLYQLDLLQAEEDFWDCVISGREPVPALPPPPPKAIGVREVSLEGNNLWAAAAADWVETREAAKRHNAATTQIKELIEPDVARAFGHGIEAKRSKAGAITIRELVL